MQNGTLEAWKKFAPFEVFGDYAPMHGFRLVLRVGARHDALERALESRAQQNPMLDPELAQWCMRAGLGLASSGVVSFVLATAEDTVVVVRADAVRRAGGPFEVQNRLLSSFAGRLSLLAGAEIPCQARIFEFPDVTVVRRALVALAEDVEETTPRRSSMRLGLQLRGRGLSFHPSMVETLEEQTSLLQANGVDMDALPPWWWRGVGAVVRGDGQVQIYDELPHGESLGALIVD